MIFVQLDDKTLEQIISVVVTNTIKVLEEKKLIKPQSANEKTAYQKTEQLLYNYNNFQKIILEKKKEIEEIKKYGVPGRAAGFEYTPHSNIPNGIVLEEERVEEAVRSVEASVQATVQAVALIDKCMSSLKFDPYYRILTMRYLEGRTLEDIGVELKCTQQNVSYHKSRLVKELALRLFPDQVVNEIMN